MIEKWVKSTFGKSLLSMPALLLLCTGLSFPVHSAHCGGLDLTDLWLSEEQKERMWNSEFFQIPSGATQYDSLKALHLDTIDDSDLETLCFVVADIVSIDTPPLESYPFYSDLDSFDRNSVAFKHGLSTIMLSVLTHLNGNCSSDELLGVYFGETIFNQIVWTDAKSPLLAPGHRIFACFNPDYRSSGLGRISRARILNFGNPDSDTFRADLVPTIEDLVKQVVGDGGGK